MATLQQKLQEELPNALRNQEFVLYYQPEFNVTTGTFAGVEALIRWRHPKLGLVMPGDFIPLAEQSDIISDIGNWVLVTACSQNKNWQKKGLPAMRVAVNVAARQFDHADFANFVLQTLDNFQLDPRCLELELSENTIIHVEDKHIIDQVTRLSQAGVQIALDDFGTGYTTINYLKIIPVNRIKIDKSYIENINTNPDDAAMVKGIIDLATTLELQVLAEGVETLKQLQAFLHIKGVETQGFYFSEPLPCEEVEKFLLKSLFTKGWS